MIWKYFVVGQVMGDYDTDVAEFLYKPGAQRAGLSKLLCKDLSKACVGKVPPVPKVILATCELPYLSALLSVQCIFISQCTSHLSKFMLYLQLVPMLGLLGAIKFLYLDFTMIWFLFCLCRTGSLGKLLLQNQPKMLRWSG